MRGAILALAAATALCACGQAEAPAPAAPIPEPSRDEAPATGFSRQPGLEIDGFYIPGREVRVGPWRLHHLFVGSRGEFRDWEAAPRPGAFAPLMLHFENVASALIINETGGQSRAVIARAVPSAYRIDAGRIRFAGAAPEIGQVVMEARMDPDAVENARAAGGGQAPVMRADLTIDGRPVRDVPFVVSFGD